MCICLYLAKARQATYTRRCAQLVSIPEFMFSQSPPIGDSAYFHKLVTAFMTVRVDIGINSGLFYITFTCYKWIPLFEITYSYDVVYKWFDYLKSKGHYICRYVIMPNHVHAIIGFKKTSRALHTIIGNGKRFKSTQGLLGPPLPSPFRFNIYDSIFKIIHRSYLLVLNFAPSLNTTSYTFSYTQKLH